MTVLIAIPTLNEAAHIAAVLDQVRPFAETAGAQVVVADGGSTDGTQAIVAERAARHPWLALIDNPGRYQSAAVNRAVERFGDGRTWLIRLDAHSHYPPNFCETLLAEAERTGADSVVVTMRAEGATPLQSIIAAAQNSRFGNGASAHRNATDGRWVDHGHHALTHLDAFRAVGGYDPAFSHNEDAELDLRLRQAGHRIWLTARTEVTYLPRRTLGGLLTQYYRFGRGRARNLAKHRTRPAPRQAVVAALAPALLLTLLAPLHPVFLAPLVAWLAACLVAGLVTMAQNGRAADLLAGPVACLMQAAWSAGFWRQMLGGRDRSAP